MQNSMIKAKRNILSCIAILLVSLCSAQWTMAASEKEILGNLSAVRPDLNFEFVGEAALPGFYAVQVKAVRCSMSLPMAAISLMAISTKLPASNLSMFASWL